MDKKVEYITFFNVRNDKTRGILLESFEAYLPTADDDAKKNEYFFKWHDQPLKRHCVKIQNIVTSANVLRSKRIRVNIAPFLDEYYRTSDKSFRFKGTKLINAIEQKEKNRNMVINKEVGIQKRKQTIAGKKAREVEEYNRKFQENLEKEEAAFLEERNRRLAEIMVNEKK